ncbi:helix-turn-helix transcriptional regulator [Levilactobacillus mulengensis]|uniref:helix-turn-helix transcriptional regulator n=1 Tax=Levilactobacillus mulengensis TaxID=2486025 RepID=UPI000F783B76|nr:WYL domain-containing protein [Levilactobacillus mulengensis]
MNAAYRQLTIFQLLLTNHLIRKAELADQFHVSSRMIQRDISQIRQFFTDQQLFYRLTYDHQSGGYQLATTQATVSKQALLLLIKIVLASRALTTEEMNKTIDGLLQLIPVADQNEIRPIIKNERFYYQPVHHGRPLLDAVWQLTGYISHRQTITITYQRQHREIVTRTILPEAIIFSEYYFYVVAYNAKYKNNLFYRVDRILHTQVNNQQPITRTRAERVEDGEIRQLVHYMQPGRKLTVRFKFWGIVEAALDRFPTAKVIKRCPDEGAVLIEAIAFDRGAKMWLLSQGALVQVQSPSDFVADMRAELQRTLDRY